MTNANNWAADEAVPLCRNCEEERVENEGDTCVVCLDERTAMADPERVALADRYVALLAVGDVITDDTDAEFIAPFRTLIPWRLALRGLQLELMTEGVWVVGSDGVEGGHGVEDFVVRDAGTRFQSAGHVRMHAVRR